MFRLILAKIVVGVAVFWATAANAQESKLVYSDDNGVEMFYNLVNTGQLVSCSEQFKNDPKYTTKRLRIWRVIVTVANRSRKRIFPRDWSSSINVEDSGGSSLDYCHFEWHPSMSPFAGSEHSLMSFGVTHNPRNIIAPGQRLQVSRYIYLYEDRKPVVTSAFFPGYTVAKEKTAGKKKKPTKKQGRTVERYADGTVHEGPYENGKRHGRWVLRFPNGVVDGPRRTKAPM